MDAIVSNWNSLLIVEIGSEILSQISESVPYL